MRNRNLTIVAVLALAVLATPACVSNKLFKSNVEDMDSRITTVENAIENTDQHIDELRASTDARIDDAESSASQAKQIGQTAMTAAERAEKGKLLWTVTITDDKVKFNFGHAELTADAISALDTLVERVKGYGRALYLEVEGHTDDVGNPQYNIELAEERAMAVRNYLNKSGGIPLHAMNTISYGEKQPIADNSSDAGRAQNRRVVIRVLE